MPEAVVSGWSSALQAEGAPGARQRPGLAVVRGRARRLGHPGMRPNSSVGGPGRSQRPPASTTVSHPMDRRYARQSPSLSGSTGVAGPHQVGDVRPGPSVGDREFAEARHGPDLGAGPAHDHRDRHEDGSRGAGSGAGARHHAVRAGEALTGGPRSRSPVGGRAAAGGGPPATGSGWPHAGCDPRRRPGSPDPPERLRAAHARLPLAGRTIPGRSRTHAVPLSRRGSTPLG